MEIDLGRGRVALIDDEDWFAVRCNYRKDGTVDRVSPCELSWYLHETAGGVSVVSCYRRNGEKSGYTIYLQALVTERPIGMVVRFINGNRLDNRRSNLTMAATNYYPKKRRQKKCSAKYRGVLKDRNRYVAKIRTGGLQKTVGRFYTALEAAFCYDDAARIRYGAHALLNFPERKLGQKIRLSTGIVNGVNSATRKRKVIPNFDGAGHTKIDIGGNAFAIIDDADWAKARTHYWTDGDSMTVKPSDVIWSGGGSLKKYICSTRKLWEGRSLLLHRLLTECPPGLVVDHIDGNPLNNTQANLRICTNAQNVRNTRKRKRTNNKYKGVFFVGKAKYAKRRYTYTIQADSRLYRGGKYQTALEAALAYDDMAIRLHGEFAGLNFPERHRAKAIA